MALSVLPSLEALAGPDNIAPLARVTASTELNPQYAAHHIQDGRIGIDGKNEWACEGVTTDWGYIRFPWIAFEWNEVQIINKIILYDRPSLEEHTAGGRLIFSDGSVVWVNEIPNDGTAKVVEFDPKHVSSVRFEVTDGNGKDLGLSEMEVFPVHSDEMDYVSWVDPYIETNRGRYFFFITGARPFGMVGAAPHTRNKNQNGGGYNYNESDILGFGQIHSWMLSGIEIMPANHGVDPTGGEAAWKSKFRHDDELVRPGYHRVFLRDPKTWVELTATERVSFYRFRYTEQMNTQLLLNLGGYLANSTMADADVRIVSDKELQGSVSSVDRYWGGPRDVKIFFVIQFDTSVDSFDGWKGGERYSDISEVRGNGAGLSARYKVNAGDEIQIKIAISYTSIENARNNLLEECDTWDFEKVAQESRDIWNDWLGKIDVKGGTTEQKVKFYTDLWHVLLGRQKINDVSGDYPDRTTGIREGTFTNADFKIRSVPKDEKGKPKFNMYNSDAWWLTQWNLNVLWGLAWPEIQDDMSASMVQYADNGGLLPRGPAGGGYSYIMTGNPATNLIGSTYQKGLLTKVAARHAFNTIKRNQMPGGMLGDSVDVAFYMKYGWWKDNAGITIEASFQDWVTGQMAFKLGLMDDFRYFSKRSKSWESCFNPKHGLLFPKDSLGRFVHDDPLNGSGWVEANAWQATWGVSHDIPGLATLMGGNDVLVDKLNHAFEKSVPQDFVFAYSDGYVSYANQPGLSNAHVFSYAGKPWLTQYWVRQVKEKAYGGVTPDLGYGGHDEDQGQMGGLSALMAIGLFNIHGNASAVPVYEITSPIFDEITIKLDTAYYPSDRFKITTHNNSAANMYIQKVALNGESWNDFWFKHEDYARGGHLEIWLGPAPNVRWGVGKLPPSIRYE